MSGKPPTDRDERTLGPDEERSHSSSRQSLTSFTRPLLDVGSWPEAADLECIAPDGKLPLGPLCCPSKKITGARSKSALTENAPYKACSAIASEIVGESHELRRVSFFKILYGCSRITASARLSV